MKAARVYMKPDGNNHADFGLPENSNMASTLGTIRAEGGMAGGMVFIPIDVIHHVVLFEVTEAPTNLTVYPGGKLN